MTERIEMVPIGIERLFDSLRDTVAMAGGSGRGHQHPIPPTPPSRRHAWVTGTAEAPGPHPGIVLAWEQRDGRWFALVSYYLEADGVLAQQWLAAELLTPVGEGMRSPRP